MKFVHKCNCMLFLALGLAGCGEPQLVLSLPEQNLAVVSSRQDFDAVSYLESIRIVRGKPALTADDKIIIASLVYDAYSFPTRSNDFKVSAECDLVRLVELNLMATNTYLRRTDGLIKIADIVSVVRPYVPNAR